MQTCAQVMLTLDNLAVASQFANTCSTFDALFSYDIVPVVNENDTVAVDELRSFGDNDTLSAKVGPTLSLTLTLNVYHVSQCFACAKAKHGSSRAEGSTCCAMQMMCASGGNGQ